MFLLDKYWDIFAARQICCAAHKTSWPASIRASHTIRRSDDGLGDVEPYFTDDENNENSKLCV